MSGRRTWGASSAGPEWGEVYSTGGLEMAAYMRPWEPPAQPESCEGCGAPFERDGCAYCGRGQLKRR